MNPAHNSNVPRTSPEESSTTEQIWACPTCTFENRNDRSTCEVCLGQRPDRPMSTGSISLNIRDDILDDEIPAATMYDRCYKFMVFFFDVCGSAFIAFWMCSLMNVSGWALALDSLAGGLLGGCLFALCGANHYCTKLFGMTCTSFLVSFLMYSLMGIDTRSAVVDSIIVGGLGACFYVVITSHRSCSFLFRRRLNPNAMRAANRQLLLSFLREQQQNAQNQAASSSFIATLPTHVMTAAEADAAPEKCRLCTICIEDFQAGDKIQTLPCFHRFHKACVGRWLRQNGVCPVCKHEIHGIVGDVTV